MKIFLWKKDAFDCAGIRAQVFRLPVNCSNQLIRTELNNFILSIENKKFNFLTKICLQYYKIDLSFSIKLKEINLYLYEEHKTRFLTLKTYLQKETEINLQWNFFALF